MREQSDDRVSLAGVDPEAALRALLAVDPDAPDDEPDDDDVKRPKRPKRADQK